jgi:hypothetical protein
MAAGTVLVRRVRPMRGEQHGMSPRPAWPPTVTSARLFSLRTRWHLRPRPNLCFARDISATLRRHPGCRAPARHRAVLHGIEPQNTVVDGTSLLQGPDGEAWAFDYKAAEWLQFGMRVTLTHGDVVTQRDTCW